MKEKEKGTYSFARFVVVRINSGIFAGHAAPISRPFPCPALGAS